MKALNQVKHFIRGNSPELLAGAAIVGVVSTAYLASKATLKTYKYVTAEEERSGTFTEDNQLERWKHHAPNVWVWWVPPVVSGATTVGAIVMSNRIQGRRAAAAAGAYAIAERALSDYRDQVIEKFGEKADEEIQAEVAQKRADDAPPRQDAIVITNAGSQLCQEAYTGRYFLTDMETLRRAQNDLNAALIQQDMVTLSEWYHMIGLGTTSHDHDLGWYSDKMMELQFSAVITDDGRPCMVFEYNYVKPLFL